jgi:hypothetical protein
MDTYGFLMISLIKQAIGRHIRCHDLANQVAVFCVHILGCVNFQGVCSIAYGVTATQGNRHKASSGLWKQEQIHEARRTSSRIGTRKRNRKFMGTGSVAHKKGADD